MPKYYNCKLYLLNFFSHVLLNWTVFPPILRAHLSFNSIFPSFPPHLYLLNLYCPFLHYCTKLDFPFLHLCTPILSFIIHILPSTLQNCRGTCLTFSIDTYSRYRYILDQSIYCVLAVHSVIHLYHLQMYQHRTGLPLFCFLFSSPPLHISFFQGLHHLCNVFIISAMSSSSLQCLHLSALADLTRFYQLLLVLYYEQCTY